MLSTESRNTIDLDLQKYWLILKRRWRPAISVFGSILLLAAIIAFIKPGYKAKGKLLIKKMNQTSALTGLAQQMGELDALTLQSNPLKTESEVISSTPLLQKTIDTLQLKNDDGSPIDDIDKFAKKFKFKAIGATDVLEISYIDSDPKKSAAVVNQLMKLYIENSIQTNRSEAARTIDFITKQLPKTEARVHQADLALRRFKQENQVIDLPKEAEVGVENISNLDKQIIETQAALKEVNARLANIQEKMGIDVSAKQAIDLNSLNQSLGVQKALQELQQVEAKLKLERTRFLDINPTIVNLVAKRDALKTLLQERVKQIYKNQQQVPNVNLDIGQSKQTLNEELVKLEEERSGLTSRLILLSSAQKNYQKRLSILPKLEEKQRQLERQLEAAQSTYQTLLKKLQEIRVAENVNTGNARIIQPALVPIRISLKKPAIILGLGMVMAVLLSGATVLFLEARDTSVKTLQEIKELFTYTFLGVIPSFKKQSISGYKDMELTAVPEIPVRDAPRSPISDAYRQLQANLKFLNSDKALQVIVVTSSVPKEGKSTVSANLGAAIAQLGRRVLLVDADLRHSMQHHIWGQTNVAGLSDVIIGQAKFEAVVNPVMDRLDLLTAGVIPPNPLALLDSNRMGGLVESFCKDYDFVIIDAPPLLVGGDALTLGKLADGLLLVARPGVLNYTSAAASAELLENSSLEVLGLVINGVILENESDSYFHYTKRYYSQQKSAIDQKNLSYR